MDYFCNNCKKYNTCDFYENLSTSSWKGLGIPEGSPIEFEENGLRCSEYKNDQ